MRVMLDADEGNGDYTCAVGYGQIKDYLLNVSAGNAAPVASNVQISGTVQVGQDLTGSYTYSDAESDAQGASTFQWYRSNDNSGTGKTPIGGATAITYTLGDDDLGKYISFQVTPIAAVGTSPGTAVESGYTAAVTAAADTTAPTAPGEKNNYLLQHHPNGCHLKLEQGDG